MLLSPGARPAQRFHMHAVARRAGRLRRNSPIAEQQQAQDAEHRAQHQQKSTTTACTRLSIRARVGTIRAAFYFAHRTHPLVSP